ncbi:hypothetical protein GIB67_014621 [Kingdonia uniflora]|uniref:PCI domain-containing protein n=1 Tax=Kingdonia uniflora TaxID=39325 RepID=A0A7J7NV15_9MAGN|nr:hypothetical protein GIB67_014621 [Kingdonia uniflora]
MFSTAGSKPVSWTMHRTDNISTENGVLSNSSFHQDQRTDPLSRDAQDGRNAVGSSSLGATNGPQEYTGYSSYPSSSDPYGYGNTGYQGYYYGYQQQNNGLNSQSVGTQQQTNSSYSQPVGIQQQTSSSYPAQVGTQQQVNSSYAQPMGTYQNTGAPYQPLTSFPNSGSYAGSTSYSSTYYNNGDYQTTGGYTSSSSYNNPTNSWNDESYAAYTSHQYSSYTSSDSNCGRSSTTTTTETPLSYEQQYKQWADYYGQNTSDVSCAPGTENTTASTLNYQIPGVTSGYPVLESQPPPPGTTTSFRSESSSLVLPPPPPLPQASAATSDTHNAYWRHEAPLVQNHNATQTPSYAQTPSYGQNHNASHIPSYSQTPSYGQTSSYFQKPLDPNPAPYDYSQETKKTTPSQLPHYQFSAMPQVPHNYQSATATHQVPQSYQLPLQTAPSFDTRQVSKLQIPINPRIASNSALGVANTDKDGSTTNASIRPAYISVAVTESNNQIPSHGAGDSMLKPGMFPASLRAYVERALARCKSDTQKAACQNILKEIITKASTDGTLFTRDWDVEPLFSLPTVDAVNMNLQTSSIASSLSKYKRSPSRRTKSRWEPLPEEKLTEKLASIQHVSGRDFNWNLIKERDRTVASGKFESKEDVWCSAKVSHSKKQTPSKNFQRPAKKTRVGDTAVENGNASSDSDKEQGLAAYYSGALTLANSPEEKKRREDRCKRFEKGHKQRAEIKHFKPKAAEGSNLYTRRADAVVLSKSFESDSGSRAVEDIDWDSLTVRGTCQEIEKRYLRLTSAPDPATVRPEDILEKALLMVHSSTKNYSYKCDQLKSIRQDLTVQRIHNELTVKVYETHARLALEAGDLPEFNQCQSQLKTLYAEGIKGCRMEFYAYSLLCVILHSNNNRDLLSSMARLSDEAKKNEAVKHALAVRTAVTSGNYVLFFRLYKTSPNLGICLMDLYVEKMRFEAVKCISRSYRPTAPLSFIAQVLGFSPTAEGSEERDSANGLEECEEWLKLHGACLIMDNSGDMQLDTKASSSSLYMPEPEDAVAHGDTNLAVNDFFTRTS